MKASAKHLRISPHKAMVVAGMLRGKSTEKALDFLKVANKKAADLLYKVLASAVANAENNEGKRSDNLVISRVCVTKGRTLRRGVPASRGRVAPIKKRSSHIFIELEEVSVIPQKVEEKKEKTVKKTAEKKSVKKS